ncbi:MAG: hypothetical protein M9927_20325 [Anaerolineae bacterium]|nr:hypothetical protein [Anaerolineae bacterium]
MFSRINLKRLIVALSILGVLLLWALSFAPHIQDDDTIYITLAKSLVEQGRLAAPQVVGQPPLTYQPLLSIMISPILRWFPSFPGNLIPLTAGSSLLFGLISLALFYWLLRSESLLTETQRWLVWLLAATSFVLIPYVVQYVMTETLYMMISLAAILLLMRYERAGSAVAWSGLLTGVALGLSYYARAVGATLIVASMLYLLLARRNVRKTAVTALVVALTVAPWWYRNAQLGAEPLGGRYTNLLWRKSYWLPVSETIGGPLELVSRVLSNTRAHISDSMPSLFVPWLTHPTLTARLTAAGLTWILPLAGVIIALVILIGFVYSWRRRFTVLHLYLPLYVALILLPPWVTIRNWVPVIPFLYLWFALGLVAVSRWLAGRFEARSFQRPTWVAAVLVILLLSNLIRDVGHVRRGQEFRQYGVPWPIEERVLAEASAWIVDNTRPEDLVLHIQPQLLYLYTGRQTTELLASNDPVQISTLDPQAVVADVYQEFDYVVRFSHKDLIPGLAEELARHPANFELVYDNDAEPRIQVYRVRKPRAAIDASSSLVSQAQLASGPMYR